MQEVKGKMLSLFELARNEEVPESMITNKNESVFVGQAGEVFLLRNSPAQSFLTTAVDKDGEAFANSQWSEPCYKRGFVYMLGSRWKDFSFPVEKFRYVMKYFQQIYDAHKTEAAVLLMVNMTTKQWEVAFVPQLDCSGGGVNYVVPQPSLEDVPADSKKRRYYEAIFNDPEAKALMVRANEEYQKLINSGYVLYGTIHSHCNFSAFHSGTDDADETAFDGLHITIGNVNSGWTFATRVVAGGAFFKKELSDVLDVTNDSDLKGSVADIVIDPYHMDLIKPNLGRPVYVHNGNKGYFQAGNSHFNWNGKATKKDRKNSQKSKHLWQGPSQGGRWIDGDDELEPVTFNPDMGLEEEDFEDGDHNIFMEDDLIRLWDVTDKEFFVVTKKYYEKNIVQFPTNKYVPTTFGHNTPPAVPASSLEATTEIYLINDPSTGGNGAGPLLALAEEIDAPRLKAKKKEKA